MSEFANTPEMDWFSAVEHGAEGGRGWFRQRMPSSAPTGTNLSDDEVAAPANLETVLGYQIRPQTLDEPSNGTGYDTLLGYTLDTTGTTDADVPPKIEFESGCRVVGYQEPKSRRKRQIEDPQGDRFVCLWSPCKSTRTFGREAELRRHYDEQHVRSTVFDCMAVDCLAKGPRGFARLHKLSIHLQTHHSRNTPFLCPVSQCGAGPFPPELLYVHLIWHKTVWPDYEPQRKSLVVMCFSCPVQGCNVNPVHEYHRLTFHDIDTRKRDASAILAAGYNPTSGFPICPMCNAELASFGSEWDRETLSIHFRHHDYQSLYKYRREILRVWPWFDRTSEFKQVIEDILPTVDRADVGSKG